MYYSPLEQFKVLPLFVFFHKNFCITNIGLTLIFVFLSILFFQKLISKQYQTTIVPSRNSSLHESFYVGVLGLVEDNLGKKGFRFFPFFFVLTYFVLFSNVLGLVPYSFTTTSHLVVTLALAFSVFGATTILTFSVHGLRAFATFLPPKTSLLLSFLLVPVEILSFLFKPLSLGLRLFANIIAGHTLLKVIGGFSWTIIKKGGLFFLVHFVHLGLLFLLIGLELGVALLQAYVFLVLILIYLREAI